MPAPGSDHPPDPDADSENINWYDVMTAGTTLRWSPREIYRATLPELLLAVEGRRNEHGIKPAAQPMTRERLIELQQRYG